MARLNNYNVAMTVTFEIDVPVRAKDETTAWALAREIQDHIAENGTIDCKLDLNSDVYVCGCESRIAYISEN